MSEPKGVSSLKLARKYIGKYKEALVEIAELRAALEGIEELLSKPNTDALGGMARRLGAVGIARAALAATEGSE